MSFYAHPKPFVFAQFTEGSKVTLVLMPTFVDVVFYDEALGDVNWFESGVPQCLDQLDAKQAHLAA